MADRWAWWLVAIVLVAAGAALWQGLGDARRRSTFVPSVELAVALAGLLVLSAWVYPWGHYAFVDGEFIAEPGRTVAMSTKLPWTVVWLLLAAAIAAGRWLRGRGLQNRLRLTLNIAWAAVPLRTLFRGAARPLISTGGGSGSVDLPLALLFAVLGGAVVWVLTNPRIGEMGRIIAVVLVGVALFNWIAAFFGWYSMLQKVRAQLPAPRHRGASGAQLRGG